MIIKEPITHEDGADPESLSLGQYVFFAIFILLVIGSVVACAVLYDTRTPETVVIDKPTTSTETNIVTHKIQCIDVSHDRFCREYVVYKVIKD